MTGNKPLIFKIKLKRDLVWADPVEKAWNLVRHGP
jgi:hypothetical protein